MLVNSEKKVFVGQRQDYPDVWQMPQGGVEKNEPLLMAAFRELFEETGIKKAKLVYKSRKWFTYDLPPHLLGKTWKGRYRGQKQKWFLMAFTGKTDTDININAFPYQEFQAWKWVPINNLLGLDVDFKKPVYANVIQDFTPFLSNL